MKSWARESAITGAAEIKQSELREVPSDLPGFKRPMHSSTKSGETPRSARSLGKIS